MPLTDLRWPPAPSTDQVHAVESAMFSRTWTEDEWTQAVEHRMTDITGAGFCVAFNSCTSALHAALIAHGAVPGRTHLHTPAFGFAGTLTGAAHMGLPLRWHDVDLTDGNPSVAEIPEITLALVPDLHGVPHGWDREDVITDACQALGTLIRGAHVGDVGTACWSFSAAKLVSAPDGGAVTTNDPEIASRLRQLRDYGVEPGEARANARVTLLGHNWRPSALSMAMVARQLQPDVFALRAARARAVGDLLVDALRTAGLWTQYVPAGVRPAWHKIRTGDPDLNPERSAELRAVLHDMGVPTHLWGTTPLSRHPVFRRLSRPPVIEEGNAHTLAAATFCLGTEKCPPWTWTDEEVGQVIHSIDSL
ncbi:DegT/DnrJ/EryC1/StrS family aminotransferase [Streptomyces chilikensis]|uniref:DegT/DnrJ/EryC1/StrS family aminotransferase n=1 Tax=Streptomyces chilikensis TaxID=1194079 RepID=A0ABV3EJ91_9ACTN